MLTGIYARSMLTATRQDCVKLRDLPAAKPLPRPPGGLAKLLRRLMPKPRKTRCIHPRSI
ncbi:hypothetical protein [Leisingera aquaemixtae]|uniref:Uncharacterized protein n=1 Tax=Leisingera aquaemixtae TaxID=1396826 RepID=A0A0P1H7C0_9RHOB|nr:hypothetical protein [Leisingera aquaemixtae]CUH98908.1 hypothetical protein PHA8399_01024 [Leisingera aquaemixtae]